MDADQVVRTDMGELYDMDIKGKPLAYTPFCDNNKEMDGYRFWRQVNATVELHFIYIYHLLFYFVVHKLLVVIAPIQLNVGAALNANFYSPYYYAIGFLEGSFARKTIPY